MLKKILLSLCCALLLLGGCDTAPTKPKIGISLGGGNARRWSVEMQYMLERAEALGMDVDARLKMGASPEVQTQDCKEMIDKGISVLILMPRDPAETEEILAYAKKKGVKVIAYARVIRGGDIDLFVGYDTYKIGQTQGLHLAEKVYEGNIAILKGDKDDMNSSLMYDGAMKYIRPLVEHDGVKIILDEYIPDWSPRAAKEKLTKAIIQNDYQIDAVLAQNDGMAGVAAEVIKGLGVENSVVIIGMDAELPALKRLLKGTQDATVYMDLKAMAHTAVNEAHNLATQKKPNVNWELDSDSKFKIYAYLVNGKLVTRQNMDKILIDAGHFSHEAVYGQ